MPRSAAAHRSPQRRQRSGALGKQQLTSPSNTELHAPPTRCPRRRRRRRRRRAHAQRARHRHRHRPRHEARHAAYGAPGPALPHHQPGGCTGGVWQLPPQLSPEDRGLFQAHAVPMLQLSHDPLALSPPAPLRPVQSRRCYVAYNEASPPELPADLGRLSLHRAERSSARLEGGALACSTPAEVGTAARPA